MLLFILILSGYSAEKCVIDRCEDTLCVVETPQGTIIIDKKPHYTEGKIIQCPTHHHYAYSRHKHLVIEKINRWKKKRGDSTQGSTDNIRPGKE